MPSANINRHQTAFCVQDCNLYLQAQDHSRE
jgi:hypothetical protein